MFAIIKTGGKQYVVQPGDKIKIEKLDVSEGKEVSSRDSLQHSLGDGHNILESVLHVPRRDTRPERAAALVDREEHSAEHFKLCRDMCREDILTAVGTPRCEAEHCVLKPAVGAGDLAAAARRIHGQRRRTVGHCGSMSQSSGGSGFGRGAATVTDSGQRV